MIRKNKNLVKLFLFLSAAVLIVLIIFIVLSVRKKDGRFDVPIFSRPRSHWGVGEEEILNLLDSPAHG